MKIPPYLKKGDTVAIVCTACKFFPEDAKPAIELLESWGLKAKLGRTIGLDSCQLGGTDAERIADFQEMMDDDNIKAIWCAWWLWNGSNYRFIRFYQIQKASEMDYGIF